MAANKNAVQVRIKTVSASMAKGQRMHDLRIGPGPGYVDSAESKFNRVLVTPFTSSDLRKVCENRRSNRRTKRAMKSNAAVAVSGIITFGHKAQDIFENLTYDQQAAAYLEVAEAVAARVGTTLSGLVVHADESAPHAHFQMPGYTLNGIPISKVAKRQALRDIQTIAAEIMGRHAPGIERGKPRWQRIEEGETYADTIHRQAYEMRSRLPDDIEEAEAELAKLNALIDTNLERLRKALDDLRKAIDKNGEESSRAEKLRNRVAKYEQRLENARAELRRITDDQDMAKAALAKLEARKAEATMDLNELADAVAQKKTTIGNLRSKLQSLNAA